MPPAAVRHVIYLHGFASSPGSSKAQRFARELARCGVGFSCPDLNQPAFETLTITRMLDAVRDVLETIPAGPVALLGSSLGGFVAVHAAARDTTRLVDRLVLMAPAFDFGGNRLSQLGDAGIEEWRRRGDVEIFHYADNRPRRVGFALYEDAARYDAFALDLRLPMLVFQGRRDDSVPPETVEAWCRTRPTVDLRLVDDGHQLTDSMDLIWRESERFLGLGSGRRA
jgi:pimeloyl-ACP methyl ester carboxylesterase